MANSKQFIGTQLVGRDGDGIGAVERVFSNDSTGEPAWVTVRTGVMRREHVIPLEGSQADADSIRVPYTQDMVKNSPKLDFEDHLSTEDIRVLSQYYGTTAQAARSVAKPASGAPTAAAAGITASTGDAAAHGNVTSTGNMTSTGSVSGTGSVTGNVAATGAKVPQDLHRDAVPQDLHRDATLEAIRYGERLQVAKESREAGRVKLRTYVEQTATEQRVELHHETFEVERVPITDTARFTGKQPDWAEQVQEIVLFAEQAHVSKEVIPLERIIVRKKVVAEEQVLRDSVRTQQFEIVEPGAGAGRAGAAAGTTAARAAGSDPYRR